jgi:hypothetical protein
MPPPAELQLGRLANLDSFPLAHKFQNDRGECLTVLRTNRQTMGARARQRWRDGNYRIHLSRASRFGNGWLLRLLNRNGTRSATVCQARAALWMILGKTG